jgi:recombination protein RecA
MAKAKTGPTRTRAGAGQKAAIDLIRQKFGAGSATLLADERASESEMTEFISTGLDVLDHYVIGRGGLPVGRMSEVYGDYACGKTSLSYSAGASVQRMGGLYVVVDDELSFDRERAETFGVDLDSVLILQPESLEEALEMQKDVLHAHNPKNGPLLLAWDSLASSKTKASMTGAAGEKVIGEVARITSEEFPKICAMLPAARAHWMVVNQIRTKFGVMFGDNTTTPGGNAPKFHASVRIQFFGGKAIKNKFDEHVAKVVTILGAKNRLAPPFRKARVRLDYLSGYNNIWSTLEHAKRFKLITPRKEGFSGVGKDSLEDYLKVLEQMEWESLVPIPDSLTEETDLEEDDSDDED